jgi:cell division protein FtsZ
MSKADKDIADIEVVSDYIEEEKQITLTFDLPLPKQDKKEEEMLSFEFDDDIKDISVKDYVELIPVNETNEKGDVRYALEDYIEVESSMNKKQKETAELIEEYDQEIVFEKKVVKTPVLEHDEDEDLDPMNSPISEILKERAEERRRKMKDFNYKFNNAKIDDIERVPAYKRQGINLEDAKHSSETNMSRSSIGVDDNDDIKIRSNNSFLHDNVD